MVSKCKLLRAGRKLVHHIHFTVAPETKPLRLCTPQAHPPRENNREGNQLVKYLLLAASFSAALFGYDCAKPACIGRRSASWRGTSLCPGGA